MAEDQIEKLKLDGWNPQRCDAEFSYMPEEEGDDCGHMAHETFEERLMLPPEVLPLYPVTGITMIDNSMTAVGIKKGDILIIVYDNQPDDCTLVLVRVGDKHMVRFYIHDEDGNEWLLSKNEGIDPICKSERSDVIIIARILRYISKSPSLKVNEANMLIKESKRAVKKPKEVSLEHAQWVIKELGADIKIMRDWFSFYRPLVQYQVICDKDYKGFCKLIKETLPDHKPQPKYDEMQRLDDGCFRKPVEEWTQKSSPFPNSSRYDAYENWAKKVIKYLEREESHEDLTKPHEILA